MTEVELRAQLDRVKAERDKLERYSEEWAALCVEMGRLTELVWRVRHGQPVEG